MSIRRLVVTSAVMGTLAAVFAALSPAPAELVFLLSHAQATADTDGPDTVVLAACAVLAWLAWTWGAVGLALTAASAHPGGLGAPARLALSALLPASARRAAAVALGVGLGMGGPWLAGATGLPGLPASSAPAPDWPAAGPRASGPTDPVPERPDRPPPGAHVVVRGDCLWDIVAARLAVEAGHRPTAGEIAAAVQAWWRANAEVIGPDPDLLLPGQVLRPPATR
jgi:hypothetical protein